MIKDALYEVTRRSFLYKVVGMVVLYTTFFYIRGSDSHISLEKYNYSSQYVL